MEADTLWFRHLDAAAVELCAGLSASDGLGGSGPYTHTVFWTFLHSSESSFPVDERGAVRAVVLVQLGAVCRVFSSAYSTWEVHS